MLTGVGCVWGTRRKNSWKFKRERASAIKFVLPGRWAAAMWNLNLAEMRKRSRTKYMIVSSLDCRTWWYTRRSRYRNETKRAFATTCDPTDGKQEWWGKVLYKPYLKVFGKPLTTRHREPFALIIGATAQIDQHFENSFSRRLRWSVLLLIFYCNCILKIDRQIASSILQDITWLVYQQFQSALKWTPVQACYFVNF